MPSPRHSAATLLAAISSVFKAVPEDQLADMLDVAPDPGNDTSNFRQQQQAIPAARAIRLGNEQQASGAGTRMVAEYSNTASQTGLSELYREFAVLMARAKAETILADVASSDEDRNARLGKAQTAIGTARQILAKTAEEMEDSDGDEDDEMERAAAKLKKAEARLEAVMKGNATAKAADVAALPTLTQAGLMDVFAGRRSTSGLSMPPDFSVTAKARVSLSERLESALERGDLNDHEGLEAETVLQHYELAKANRIPMPEFEGSLLRTSDAVKRFLGVEAVTGHLTLRE